MTFVDVIAIFFPPNCQTEKSEYIARGSTVLCILCFHLRTAIPNFAQKTVYFEDEKGRFIILGKASV